MQHIGKQPRMGHAIGMLRVGGGLHQLVRRARQVCQTAGDTAVAIHIGGKLRMIETHKAHSFMIL